MAHLKSTALYEVHLEISQNPEADIIQMSSGFDALIMGMRHVRNPEASLPFRVSHQAACSVLLVKTISRFKKLTRRI